MKLVKYIQSKFGFLKQSGHEELKQKFKKSTKPNYLEDCSDQIRTEFFVHKKLQEDITWIPSSVLWTGTILGPKQEVSWTYPGKPSRISLGSSETGGYMKTLTVHPYLARCWGCHSFRCLRTSEVGSQYWQNFKGGITSISLTLLHSQSDMQ